MVILWLLHSVPLMALNHGGTDNSPIANGLCHRVRVLMPVSGHNMMDKTNKSKQGEMRHNSLH